MEFEQNLATDRSPEIDDAARLAASTRSTTLTPIHEDITPEDNGNDDSPLYRAPTSAVPNAPIDTESTSAPAPTPTINPAAAVIKRAKNERSRGRIWILSTIGIAIIAIVSGILYFLSIR